MIEDDANTVDLYSVLTTQLGKCGVAKCFKRAGWSLRASAWDEYEIETETSELEIVGEDEILLSGQVNQYPATVSRILEVLRKNGIGYQLECYDSQGNLLTEYRTDQHSNPFRR